MKVGPSSPAHTRPAATSPLDGTPTGIRYRLLARPEVSGETQQRAHSQWQEAQRPKLLNQQRAAYATASGPDPRSAARGAGKQTPLLAARPSARPSPPSGPDVDPKFGDANSHSSTAPHRDGQRFRARPKASGERRTPSPAAHATCP